MINRGVNISQTLTPLAESDPARALALDRPLVLVGLMGAGKTRVGKRLSERLGLPFIDTDQEIEKDHGKTIAELFAVMGEPAFREGERRFISRILQGDIAIVAAGGGAFMDARTRAKIRECATALWLRADLDTLVSRTARSKKRPLLNGVDPAAKLAELMTIRHPVYEEADIVVESLPGPVEQTVEAVLDALRQYRENRP